MRSAFAIISTVVFLSLSDGRAYSLEIPSKVSIENGCYKGFTGPILFEKRKVERIQCVSPDEQQILFSAFTCRQPTQQIDGVLTGLTSRKREQLNSLQIFEFISNLGDSSKYTLDVLGEKTFLHVCQAGPGSAIFLAALEFKENQATPFVSDFKKEILSIAGFSESQHSTENNLIMSYDSPKNWPEIRVVKQRDSVLVFYYLLSDKETVDEIIKLISNGA